MATVMHIESTEFNVKDVTFVQGLAKAGRNAPINLKYGPDKQNFQLLLPFNTVRFLERTDPSTGQVSYTLSYPLTGCDRYGRDRMEGTTDTQTLYNSLLDLEELVVQAAIENSPKWFGKKRSEEGIRESFKRIISVSTDKIDGEYVPNGKYDPSLRIKIGVYDGKVSLDKAGIVDPKGNDIYVKPETLRMVFPNDVKANLAIAGSIYIISGGSFGISWKLRTAQVFPQERSSAVSVFMKRASRMAAEPSHEETRDEDEEAQETTRAESPAPAPAPTVAPSAPARKKRAPAS